MPKYTFLLPAYKARFMREALRSILAQTYTDFCVLVSDDCSPEDLKSIVDEFAGDPRVTYRRNERNMGSQSLVSHWNLLVDMCQTEWLIMASDDDIYDPRFLEEVDALQGKYPQVDLVRGRVKAINAEGEVFREDAYFPNYIDQASYVLDYYHLDCVVCIANFVFRSSALKAIGGFVDYPLALGSDEMTTFLMSTKGLAITSDILFSFRVSGINISDPNASSLAKDRMWFKSKMMYEEDLTKLVESLDLPRTPLMQHKYQRMLKDRKQDMREFLVNKAYVLSFSQMRDCLKRYRRYLDTKHARYSYIMQWLKYTIRHGFIVKSRTV